MIIQSTNGTAPAPRPADDGAPAPAAAPRTEAPDPPQENVKAAAAVQQAAQPSIATQPTPAELQRAVEGMNKAMRQINSNLEFSIDHDTRKTVIKVVESETGQVIRQFPSEEMLTITQAIDDAQKNLLLKQTA
ncbi:MAG: flagellar protein FlaG [Nitrosomonadales bacterium]|nr:flagellar protein FlaG [Nitrosomonadales bacterium]